MPENSPGPKSPVAPSKRRSPLERIAVWGGIGVLILCALLEYSSQQSSQRAFESLSSDLQKSETNNAALKEADVLAAVGGKSAARSEDPGRLPFVSKRVDTYIWRGAFKQYPLYVYYGIGDQPDVVSVGFEKEKSADEVHPPPTEAQWAEHYKRASAILEAESKRRAPAGGEANSTGPSAPLEKHESADGTEADLNPAKEATETRQQDSDQSQDSPLDNQEKSESPPP